MIQKRYFTSQTFDSNSELSQVEAVARGNYVSCYFNSKNEPDYSELVEAEQIYRIVFYNRTWPNDEILRRQLTSTIKVPFEVISPCYMTEDGEIEKSYCFTPEGKLDLMVEKHINKNGDLQSEKYIDEDQNFLGSIEYEYENGTGDLIFSREYAADGKLISEYEC